MLNIEKLKFKNNRLDSSFSAKMMRILLSNVNFDDCLIGIEPARRIFRNDSKEKADPVIINASAFDGDNSAQTSAITTPCPSTVAPRIIIRLG